jgi:hypothetical protein
MLDNSFSLICPAWQSIEFLRDRIMTDRFGPLEKAYIEELGPELKNFKDEKTAYYSLRRMELFSVFGTQSEVSQEIAGFQHELNQMPWSERKAVVERANQIEELNHQQKGHIPHAKVILDRDGKALVVSDCQNPYQYKQDLGLDQNFYHTLGGTSSKDPLDWHLLVPGRGPNLSDIYADSISRAWGRLARYMNKNMGSEAWKKYMSNESPGERED